jgi:hypothetical protein
MPLVARGAPEPWAARFRVGARGRLAGRHEESFRGEVTGA